MVVGGFTPFAVKSVTTAKSMVGETLNADLIQEAAKALAQEVCVCLSVCVMCKSTHVQ